MPLVSEVPRPGRIGFILPLMPTRSLGRSGDRTDGRTDQHTFGTTEWVVATASAAEAAGADALWATDHLFWCQPAGECMTTLAAAAVATRRALLGTCVLQLPLRSAAVVAKQAAALQALSGGRFVLGVGVGSHRGEYDAAGVSFTGRGRSLDAGIAALRRAWTAGPESDVSYRMAPALPAPVWVGGSSPAALRRAATLGDGWVPLFVDPDRFETGLLEVRELAADAGRDPSLVTPAVVMVASPGDDVASATDSGLAWLADLYGLPPKAFRRHLVAGTPEHCAEVAARYHDAGAAHVVIMVASDDALDGFTSIAAALAGRTGTGGGSSESTLAGVSA